MLSVVMVSTPQGGYSTNLNQFIVPGGLTFSTGPRGFEECNITLTLGDSIKRMLFQAGGVPHIVVSDNCTTVWEGRVERTAYVRGGLRLTARGYYAAFDDVTITSLYAMSDAGAFKELEAGLVASAYPPWWDIRTEDNGVYITPKRGETHGSSINYGGAYYMSPTNGRNPIYSITFTYTFYAPAGWYALLYSYGYNANAAMTFKASEWSLNGTGAVQTGTVTQVLSSTTADTIAFIFANTNAAATLAVDTGTYYLKMTAVTVRAVSSSVDTGDIVRDLIAAVSGTNTTQLSSATVGVMAEQSTYDCVFSNTPYTDAIADLAAIGDSGNSEIEYFVYDDRALVFQQRGLYARTWYVDGIGVEMERGMEDVRNTIRATFKDVVGNERSSVLYTDDLSIDYWGLTRSVRIGSGATQLGSANAYANTQTSIMGQAVPTASIDVTTVFGESGIGSPSYVVRAGDRIVIRNLFYGQDDTLNYFYIAHTAHNAQSGVTTIELDVPRRDVSAFVGGQRAAPTANVSNTYTVSTRTRGPR